MPPKSRMDYGKTDYVEVAERIIEFRTKYPEGSLRPADPAIPYRIETVDGQTFIVVVAAAYRSPDDVLPGIGMAWEIFPGKTNFTRGSELQNAETSAWGRAIVASLAADTKRGVASADEIRGGRATRPDPLITAKQDVWRLARAKGLDQAQLADEYALWSQGGKLADAIAEELIEFGKTLEPTVEVSR